MSQTTQKLVTDVGVLVADTKGLVKNTIAQSGDKIVQIRGKVRESIANVRPRLVEADALVREKTTEAVDAADNYVHHQPWSAIGIAAGVGLVVGLLISRQ